MWGASPRAARAAGWRARKATAALGWAVNKHTAAYSRPFPPAPRVVGGREPVDLGLEGGEGVGVSRRAAAPSHRARSARVEPQIVLDRGHQGAAVAPHRVHGACVGGEEGEGAHAGEEGGGRPGGAVCRAQGAVGF